MNFTCFECCKTVDIDTFDPIEHRKTHYLPNAVFFLVNDETRRDDVYMVHRTGEIEESSVDEMILYYNLKPPITPPTIEWA